MCRPWLHRSQKNFPSRTGIAISAGPVLRQLRQWVEVCTPDHEFLNGGTQLLLEGGRVSSGFLVGEGAYDPLPNGKWLLLLLLLADGQWGPHGFLTGGFVLLPKESCQGQVLGLRV